MPLLMIIQKHNLMARFRALHPVNTLKHIVDSDGSVDASANVVVDLVNATEGAVSTVSNQVDIGSTVHSIFMKLEMSHTSTAGRPNVYMYIQKNPGNNIVNPDPRAVGVSDERRFIIHQEMVMLSGDAGNGLPRVIFSGVIKIPRSYKRMGVKDRLQLVMRTGTVTADWCVQCIYKEVR